VVVWQVLHCAVVFWWIASAGLPVIVPVLVGGVPIGVAPPWHAVQVPLTWP
jgi:anti-sigma factor RsiW